MLKMNNNYQLVLFSALTIFLLQNCTQSQLVLKAENIYTEPGVDYAEYSNVLVYLDSPRLQLGEEVFDIDSIAAEELEQLGYTVVSNEEFMSFFDKSRFRSLDFYNPEFLFEIKQDLSAAAVLKVTIERIALDEKALDHLLTVTPGRRGFSPMRPRADRSTYHINIAATFEMIDTDKAKRLWSCTFSCDSHKIEINLDKFMGTVFKKCFNTLPKKQATSSQ